jgi:drug/metabolite transporter (DMT)-like permease
VIVALVLASAALHALWNALVRLERDKDAAMVAVVAIAWALAALGAAVEVALGHALFPSWRAAAWAAAAGLGEAAYFLTLARALAAGPLAPAYTLSRGGAIVLVWPVSVALLGEPLTALGATGTAIVLAGLAASGLEGGLGGASARWAVVCAAWIACYHVAYKLALDAGAAESGTFALALAISVGLNGARLGAAGRRAARARIAAAPLRMLAMGAMCGASFLILLVGLHGGGAGFVITLRNTSVLFATALAFAIGERPGGRQVAGAILVAGGAVLLGIAQ